jgi:hypothetical protein
MNEAYAIRLLDAITNGPHAIRAHLIALHG